MKDIHYYIQLLIDYAVKKDLIKENDRTWAANQIIAKLKLPCFNPSAINEASPQEALPQYPDAILSEISKFAVKNKIIEDVPALKALFETEIIGALLQRPSDFVSSFEKIRKNKGAKSAIQWLYEKEKQAFYIKVKEIKKNIQWKTQTQYGTLDLTINLSKPEKTQKEIALLKTQGAKALNDFVYPKCVLCAQNEGFAGNFKYQARQNLRLIPMTLGGEKWYFQFSPFVYYNEHCIVLDETHKPMNINEKTFVRFLDFLEKFPHYFIGSNADLPIVGGSILNHDHYQGGNYVFPIQTAKTRKNFKLKKFPKLKCSVLDWSLSVIRLAGARKDILAASSLILNRWKNYSDITVNIKAYTKKQRHNTVTPIARKIDRNFIMDLVLRNNRVAKDSNEGIFHSAPQYHHIKRENIGLIEAMGMAILPARLKKEIQIVKDCLIGAKLEKIKADKDANKHYEWAKELAAKYKFNSKNADDILKKEVGMIFAESLKCCAVFKDDEKGRNAFDRFIKTLSQ
ncbi:MAG: UDP-glucose--hexose-1-phosphate uridylyltransferase [Endomicrobium sp.]|jgi:UDPglucose--hexose-1-phosphate uridylyltransferase|nr:UDP-glucose--hexose-1-phosphate uridylyltransferase [Endomicrobium sp.]